MGEWNFGRGKGTKNTVRYSHPCEWCGIVFKSARPDAYTCGAVHRLKLSRWKKKYRKLIGERPTDCPRGDVERQTMLFRFKKQST